MRARKSLGGRADRAPLVLGHRGYRARWPENTLLAFRKALEAGADGIECDVQKSADGRYVIIHDPTTDRVSAARGSVAALSLAQLRGLDFGRGERIPTLEEMLEALPHGACIDVELKADTLRPADCAAIARILDRRVSRRRLMISSFDPLLLEPMKALGFTVALLLGEEAQTLGAGRLARTLFRLRPDWLNLPIQLLSILGRRRTMLLLRVFRALGFRILFWTVNDAPGALAVMRAASIIVTDEVELVLGLRNGLRRGRGSGTRQAR